MKMARKESNSWSFLLIFCLIALQSFGASDAQKETHHILMGVNKNWAGLENEITHTFLPHSEQELIQLHLWNVLSYLERQPVKQLNPKQRKNRLKNQAILLQYIQGGVFPENDLTNCRTPIFIDSKQTHCAVGYLMKENGLGKVAQEIAQNQLLLYLADIEHPELRTWQKDCGLSFFELALIQPTYGPPSPVCANPTPIQWTTAKSDDSGILQLVASKNDTSFYGISQSDALGLKKQVKQYSTLREKWTAVGAPILGEIFDLVIFQNETYLSVILPEEDYPHQLLKLKGYRWEKVAYFDGNIQSIQEFQNKLYILGNFKKVNGNLTSSLIVLDGNSIQDFHPEGLGASTFDQMIASKTAMFFNTRGSIFKFKNETAQYLGQVQYYSYLSNSLLDAIDDTLYIISPSLSGYNSIYSNQERSNYVQNMMHGQGAYGAFNYSHCQKVNGKMLIAGDFSTSTMANQVNDNRYLALCEDTNSLHWFGEGLLYEHKHVYYPILKEGIVLDFIQLKDRLYLLKADGSIHYADLRYIDGELEEFHVRRGEI